MAILAKFNGFCPNCNVRFVVGKDYIEKKDNGKWCHVTCTNNVRYEGKIIKAEQVYISKINNPIPIGEELDIDALSSAIDNLDAIETEQDLEPVKQFSPSKYQADFFTALFDMIFKEIDYQHIVVEAVAGSGKTTTLIEGIKRLKIEAVLYQPRVMDICIVAFNKHIATEFQNKLAKFLGANHGILASTKHSLGLAVIRQSFPKVKVDSKGYKLGSIFDNIWPVSKKALEDGIIDKAQRKINFTKRAAMRNLVSIAKSILVDPLDGNAVMQMIERYGIEIDLDFMSEAIEQLPIILEQCKNKTDEADFDDMGWLPIVLNLPALKFDLLLIDEAQDMSKGDMEFLFRCIKDDGHIVAVGDRNQSLYGFRGADTDAIPNIIKMLDAKVLPLSVTYRCPASHVKRVQAIVPQIEARENAPEGEIRYIDIMHLASEVQPGDMVVCRTNAPLIRPAFECIRMGKKAMIRGADIGQSLVTLIKRFETDDIGSFEVSLMEYYDQEYTKLINQAKDMQAVLLSDRVQTLRFIVNECKSVSELLGKIEMLFSDNNSGVVFSSVHRAKGLEADNVYILRPDLMPHPKAKKEHEQQQEQNGIYVAQTRSKQNLIFVKGGE